MPTSKGVPSATDAAHALAILIEDGKVRARDVARALERRAAMIRELRARLAALGEGVVENDRLRRPGRKSRKAKWKITKAQHAARQAQGRYLGAIRRLSKADRAKIKAIRDKSGVMAAVAAANRLASRKTARRSKRR